MKDKKLLNNNNKVIITQKLIKYYLPEQKVNHIHYNYNNLPALNKLIKGYFSAIRRLTGKPIITITRNRVHVHIFYYIPIWDSRLNANTVNNLGETIRIILNRNVELRLVKLYYPYLNRDILAQWIVKNTRFYKFIKIVQRIFRSVKLIKNTQNTNLNLSYLIGIKIRLSGRLTTERSRPRYTVQTREIGSFSKKNNTLMDISQCTGKNKKGAFNVKVWINSQIGGL
jgi:hypothetical protein